MSDNGAENYIRQVESQVASYYELVEALERTVAEQSERLECSHEAESRLAALVESSDHAILSISPDLRVMSWNRAAEELLGYTAREAIGRDPCELYVPAAARAAVRDEIRHDFAELESKPEVVRRQEVPIARKDGSLLDAAITACGIRDSWGKVLGISVILQDITERKRTDRERALLAAIVESSDDAILSISLDLKITSWNQAAEKLFGFTAAEALGHPISIIMPPELREQGEQHIRHLQAKLDRAQSFEATRLRKDGGRIDVWIVTFGIRDRDGGLLGVSAIYRDVTARKRAARERETLAAIVNASEDAIIALDKELRITSWNQATQEVHGYTAGEALGKGPELFVPAEQLAQTIKACRRVLESGEPIINWPQNLRRKDGTPRVLSVNIFAIRDGLGNIIGVSGIGRDITKLKQIETELRAAQDYTRGLIESSIDAMVVVDRELRITDANEQLAKLTQVPKKVLIGSRFDGYFDDPAHAAAAIERVLADGYVTNYDLVMHPAGGQEILVSFNASIFYRGGQVSGIFGVARDMTEERATKRKLEAEQQYSRSLIDSSTSALLVCDSNLVLTDVNERAVRLTGYSREELKGIKLASLFTDPVRMTEIVCQSLDDESGARPAIELCLLTKNASEVPVSFTPSVYKNGDAAQRGILVSLRDITERKQYEEQRSLLASIVDSSGDAIYSENVDLTITSWNAAAERLYGYSADEIIGRNAVVLVPLDQRAELAANVNRMLRGGKGERSETKRVRKDGIIVDVGITGSPIVDSSRKLIAFSVTAHDIGERKRMDAELTRARDAALEGARLKSEFLANMSHEIRTPLNSIVGMTGLLLDTELSSEQREFAGDVRDSGETLLSLINDILDFSKIAAGKLLFEEVDFELTRVVEGAIGIVVEQARRKGLELTVSIDPEAPQFLRGDAGRLRQVLLNLLSNAIKFTQHGEVAVRVDKLSENPKETILRFEVRDTGIGIPKDKLHLLFQPFTQIDASTTRHFGGTGLGLSIIREIVKRMGGTVSVTSTPEVGSTFCFTVKLDKQLDVSRPASERFVQFAGIRILIVDDSQSSQQMLALQTSSWGMEPTTAGSAEEALKLMKTARQPYAVALIDVMMPEVDGVELARLIKTDPALSSTALVFISSVGSRSDYRARLHGLDVADWLMKPVPRSSLYESLAKALARMDQNVAPALNNLKPSGQTVSGKRLILPGDRTVRVLVAEDNPLNQKLTKLLLKKLGLEVDTVANGREAVEAVSHIPYDVVLMDCQMPEMDGYDATREIRRREGPQRHTTIVAMTAHALAGDRDKCLAAGMDAYIAKPVKPEVLVSTLAQMIAASPTTAPAAAGAAHAPAVVNGSAPPRLTKPPGPGNSRPDPHSTGDGPPADPITDSATLGSAAPPFDAKVVAALRDDGLLAELVDLFLSDTPAAIEKIGVALAIKDARTAAREAHRLKGSAAALGAQPMFELCEQLQRIESADGLEKAQALFARLSVESERVCQAFEAQLAADLSTASPA